MNISELVEKLLELKKQYGDIQVRSCAYDGRNYANEIDSLYYQETDVHWSSKKPIIEHIVIGPV